VEVEQWLDVLFGPGDDSHPFWLNVVRINILLFLFCAALAGIGMLARSRSKLFRGSSEAFIVLALTTVAAALRFGIASANLMDYGGIPYSRLLFGYKGYFATAQFYSLFYEMTSRDIEHAIFFDGLAGTLTLPLVYFLCRRLAPGVRSFAVIAAFLFAVYPPHVSFSASDTLAVFSVFLAAASYLLVAASLDAEPRRLAEIGYLGGFAGLALLTQVRYENVLLLVPPALFLIARRRAPLARIVPALVVAGGFVLVYGYEATTSGLSFRNPINLDQSLRLTIEHLLLNPFFAVPVLLAGSLAILFFGRIGLGILALLPWMAALVLCVRAAEDGHGTARIFTNWLILVLPSTAYGLALLYGARPIVLRAAAVVALVYLGALPLVTHQRLAARHLEMHENDRFRALLDNLPSGVDRIIVPDDEVMWRRHRSTLEVYRKYQAILWGTDKWKEVRLVPLTDYLDTPAAERCLPGRCLFFSGLPCMDGLMFPETRKQCAELLRTHRASLLEETTVVAAPFAACSIYVGDLAEQLCVPATAPRRFATYRLEG
jgi:hypothetical protein